MFIDNSFDADGARRPWADNIPDDGKKRKRKKDRTESKMDEICFMARKAKMAKLSYGKMEAMRYEEERNG